MHNPELSGLEAAEDLNDVQEDYTYKSKQKTQKEG